MSALRRPSAAAPRDLHRLGGRVVVAPLRRLRAGGTEQGSLAVELVVLAPALLLVLWLFGVFCLRAGLVHAEVDSAAREAARAASIARTPAAASLAATQAAAVQLAQTRPLCQRVQVRADTAAFRPGGSVRVAVSCTVRLHDLGLLALPGNRAVHASYTAPVDLYRGVQP